MTVETITGSAAGGLTQLTLSDSSNWYACTSDDSDISFVASPTSDANPYDDLYNLANPVVLTATDIISRVTFYIKVRSVGTSAVRRCTATWIFRTGSEATTYTAGTAKVPTATYTLYSGSYTTNPISGIAWTYNDIKSLQAGVQIMSGTSDDITFYPGRCTFIYTEITFAPPEVISVSKGDGLFWIL